MMTYNLDFLREEDWTQERQPGPIQQRPGYMSPFTSGTVFQTAPHLPFHYIFTKIDPLPKDPDMLSTIDHGMSILEDLKTSEVKSLTYLYQTRYLDEPRRYWTNVEDIHVPSYKLDESSLTEMIVASSWCNARIRETHTWTHSQQITAIAAVFHPAFNRRRWGAVIDCLGYSSRTSPQTADQHKEGYLLDAVLEGSYKFPGQVIRRPPTAMDMACTNAMSIHSLFQGDCFALTKADIFIRWYDTNGMSYRARKDPRFFYDFAYEAGRRSLA